MKKIYILYVALFTFNSSIAQWVQQNSGTTRDLRSVFFTDSVTGHAVGDSGIILHTANGGSDWTIQPQRTAVGLNSVFFTATNTGYAVGDSGSIFKTHDGGANWTPQSSGTTFTLHSVYFLAEDTGFAVGQHGSTLKTVNGGADWINIDVDSTFFLYSVFFTDSNTGFAVGTRPWGWSWNGIILKTINGGTDWTICYEKSVYPYSCIFGSVYFTDAQTGYVVGHAGGIDWGGMIMKTVNGGLDWDYLGLGFLGFSVFFSDAQTGYIVGDDDPPNPDYNIGKTTDSGIGWTGQISGTANALNSVYFTDAETGYVVGDHGTILKTTNGGVPLGCLPEGITFGNQVQIDNFQNNYPGCTEIEGDVRIRGGNITNLNGLSALTSIGGSLSIGYEWVGNPQLTNLTGLNNLTSIGGPLLISYNNVLTDLTGLNSLTSIGGSVQVSYNYGLVSLTGLEGLTTIAGDVKIDGNDSISDLTGLSSLTSIGGDLYLHGNRALINLTGLDNLTSIGGSLTLFGTSFNDLTGINSLTSIGGSLGINLNGTLTSISKLENLSSIGGGVNISINDTLLSLAGLEGITSTSGGVHISSNGMLSDLTGLDSLTTIGGDLVISENEDLISLIGLDQLISIGGNLTIGPSSFGGGSSNTRQNSALISLTGLNALTSIGGNLNILGNPALTSLEALQNLNSIGGTLGIGMFSYDNTNHILGNPVLTSLSGLENIDAGTIDSLYITENTSLSTCDVQSICEYLANPNGSVNIFGNATGCYDPPDVAGGCGISLPCLPYGNYYLQSQSEIDDFQTDFPGCTDLMGNVRISGGDITNLNGLLSLTSIGGDLRIFGNTLLPSFSGLDSLNFIGNILSIRTNDSLKSLAGLESLHSIGNTLEIGGHNNPWFDLGNPVLTDITGLKNVDAGSIGSLIIHGNYSLSDCAITSICDYLADSGATVQIGSNATGCNSQAEVQAACAVSISEVGSQQSAVNSYPNPFCSVVTIEYALKEAGEVSLSVFNNLGMEMEILVNERQSSGRHQVSWNAEGLPEGIYLYRLLTADCGLQTTGKMVKY